jgi:hypothetical protein
MLQNEYGNNLYSNGTKFKVPSCVPGWLIIEVYSSYQESVFDTVPSALTQVSLDIDNFQL